MQADLALKRRLQKSFIILTREYNSYKEIFKQLEPCLTALDNLGEQYVSCKKYTIVLPATFDTFHDLRQKLLFKLALALDSYVDMLRDKL